MIDEEGFKQAKREILKKIIPEVFKRKGIVLTEEDRRWLVGIAEEAWNEHLKTLTPYRFERFEGKYKRQ